MSGWRFWWGDEVEAPAPVSDSAVACGRREGRAKLADVGLAKMMQNTQISAGGLGAA